MQSYKLKGKIDLAGNLIIREPISLEPGDVEAIVLQAEVEKNVDGANEPTSAPSAQTEITCSAGFRAGASEIRIFTGEIPLKILIDTNVILDFALQRQFQRF